MSQAFDQMGKSFSKTTDSLRDFNLKMIDMMRANAEASFDLAKSCNGKIPDRHL